jgi:hypothetical protein
MTTMVEMRFKASPYFVREANRPHIVAAHILRAFVVIVLLMRDMTQKR